MIKKISIISRPSPYELYHYFSHSLAKAFQRLNILVRVIELPQPKFDPQTMETLKDPNIQDLTLSFCWFQENHWSITKIPHLYIDLSPSFGLLSVPTVKDLLFASTDRQEKEIAKLFGIEKPLFIPMAADQEIQNDILDKPFDVMFCGGCYDHQTVREIYSKQENLLTISIIEKSISKAQAYPEKGIYFCINECADEALIEKGPKIMSNLCRFVYAYLYGYERLALLKVITDAHIHVVGGTVWDFYDQKLKGWGQILADKSNVTIHPALTYPQYIELTKRTKIVLNTSPNFRDGCHERVFNALAAGAVPLTNDNPWTRNHFEDNKDLLLFRTDQLHEVNERINQILSNDQKRLEIAEQGRNQVLKNHTWDQRARTILQEFNSHAK